MHTSRGSIPFTLSTVISIATQIFSIICRCLFCQQSSKKGEIVRAKFLPRRFWRLLSKNSRGTNMRFEYKQIIRFLKDGVCVEKFEGQPRGSSYRKQWRTTTPKNVVYGLGSLEGIRNEEKAGAGSRLSLFTSFSFISWVIGKTILSRGVC